ncbi:ABC transporter substrate-binding protein [Desulfopila sp. IMCC35008]|uniref:ABC transporter substrate-binding protein n=1 Tax=Desulfopila sp. IMCC35008 TaxID=2653858 RepID=UPI0013D0660F|nr:ABC transporter substrate-binding protein [Desulfopila sp. IMCC35008]
MKRSTKMPFWSGGVIFAILLLSGTICAADVVKIGLNLALSGGREASGLAIKAGAEMVRDEINGAGGITIGDKKYTIEYVITDNRSNVQQGVNNALKLITKDNVLAILGPSDSSRAIPAGGIADAFKTPMVSPMSTNPKTTLNRPFVFRTCFLDPFQGEAMATFVTEELGVDKAAVLFNIADAYPKGLAEYFKASFEKKNGEGSVVAYEDFLTNEVDLSAHLKRIVASGAEVLFVPQYDNEIPRIVKQAKAAGWNKVILGGDAWETSGLMEQCGDMCKGFYFTSHFAAIGAKGKAEAFVGRYQQKMNALPTGDGATGYDAMSLIVTAISSLDSLSSNMTKARSDVKDKMASVRGFEGVSGVLDMTTGGDPAKSAVVIRINDAGEFESHKIINP